LLVCNISLFCALFFVLIMPHPCLCLPVIEGAKFYVSKSSSGFKRIEGLAGRILILKISIRIGTYFLKKSRNVNTLAASK
jgi:hypothetical protein